MKFLRLMFVLFIPLLFLFLGFRAGLLTSSSAESGSGGNQELQDSALTGRNAKKQQFNLLLVSVESRQSGGLKSVWLVSNHDANPELVNFVPLYPYQGSGANQLNDMLASSYNPTGSAELSPEFMQTLQSMYLVSWDGYILLEQGELSQAIHLLGGAQIGGELLTGDQLVSRFYADANGQSVIIQGVCSQLVNAANSSDVTDFADFLTSHLSVLNPDSGLSDGVVRSIISSPKLNCAFPTLSVN
jgi:hypothetical protein